MGTFIEDKSAEHGVNEIHTNMKNASGNGFSMLNMGL